MSSEAITVNDLKEILGAMPTITAPRVQGGKVGEIRMYAGADEPIHWLKCDGRAISRTEYADLFAVIGTTYGAGDGTNTFNIPDIKGRFPIGIGSLSSNTNSYWGSVTTGDVNVPLGERAGEAWHTLTAQQMPAHGHNVKTWVPAGTQGASKGWTTYGTAQYNVSSGNQLANGTWKSSSFNSAQSGQGDPTGLTDQQGGGAKHNNMPPYTAVNFIICYQEETGSGGGGGGTDNYNDLSNRPQINSITLAGNKSTSDLSIHDIPTGGSSGQVLAKSSGTNYDVGWVDVLSSGTDVPTADEVAEFDSSAKMNSTDMTSAEVDTFINALDVVGDRSSDVTITYTSAVSGGFENTPVVRGNILYVTIGGSVTQTTGWTNTTIATINGAKCACTANILAQKNNGSVRCVQIAAGSNSIVLRNLDNVSADDTFRAFISIPITFT